MFWRRSRNDSNASSGSAHGRRSGRGARTASTSKAGGGEEDELAQLQRQFGIKPVSDADVQAEFNQLLGQLGVDGGDGGGGRMSPTADIAALMRAGDDEEDDEQRILRELNISGGLDSVEFGTDDEGDASDEDQKDAKRELHGVLREVHDTAKAKATMEEQQMMPQAARPPVQPPASSAGVDVAEKVRTLKMQALALKREGKIQEALALFREAKALEANPLAAAMSAPPAPAVTAPPTLDVEMEPIDDNVEVTDEDMNDPEYLAQLATLGLVVEAPVSRMREEEIVALESQIREEKLKAVELKRAGKITEALACMRSFKELEQKLAQMVQDHPAVATAAPVVASPPLTMILSSPVDAVMQPVAPVERVLATPLAVSAAPTTTPIQTDAPTNNAESDVEVTEEDLNDASYNDELRKLGFAGSDGEENDAEEAPPVPQPSFATRKSSLDDCELIDEFEDDDDDSPVLQQGSVAYIPTPSASPPTTSQESTSAVIVPETPTPQRQEPARDEVQQLKFQLEQTKQNALRLKREGKVQDAIEMMRKMKQIENLIQLKQSSAASQQQTPVNSTASQSDPAVIAQFRELEQLLVDFANQATNQAKALLAVDRNQAAKWLSKRKVYAAELDKLRARRDNPRQRPPPYHVERKAEQVEVQLNAIQEDQLQAEIVSLNALSQAAGKDVFVKYVLAFPAAAPHEAKTETVVISDAPPYCASFKHAQSYKIQRSRGTQRLFEIKKALFEVWRPGTFLRNPELIARGYQELSPLLSVCQINCHVPFVGSNRKPTGGDVEIRLSLRYPLREKEMRDITTETLVIGPYPDPIVPTEPVQRPPQVPTPPSSTEKISPPTSSWSLQQSSAISTAVAAARSDDVLDDVHSVEQIESYDVMTEEMDKIEAKLPSLAGLAAQELGDRYDSLALKKQILEIEMQTGKLTLDMYVDRLKNRIAADRACIAKLLSANRRADAARVLHRVKIMEKEVEGAEASE